MEINQIYLSVEVVLIAFLSALRALLCCFLICLFGIRLVLLSSQSSDVHCSVVIFVTAVIRGLLDLTWLILA